MPPPPPHSQVEDQERHRPPGGGRPPGLRQGVVQLCDGENSYRREKSEGEDEEPDEDHTSADGRHRGGEETVPGNILGTSQH